ncbi:acyl-CoA synthetase (AMP-forming)/AMP-acid ligase II [Streptosporangium album]|uniref:Acyl-CoA synthetase (AMP-forming)/AMP-acid ligase II n=1 Tax=Streptosporangium album TaxID=47479 RepID=A0A7W7WF97_9ACTN|nr:class I adenylate-forming enzyme family protein [Streptosporangium album]MBB4944174.1 acyl-CoA synthetase (AMP-forming)/AMP-acid ligase II [Streptosporangium album]
MNLALILQMAADGLHGRAAVGPKHNALSYTQLYEKAQRVSAWLAARGARRADLVGVNSEAVPLLLFGAALAGVPFVPLNYRLADDRLRALAGRTIPAVAVTDTSAVDRLSGIPGVEVVPRAEFLAVAGDESVSATRDWGGDPDDVAVLLFTSGTTGEPKAAVLRHRHLVSYVVSTVEFMGADSDEATLVSVPPYHIAGITALLSSVYAGRRVVQLPAFDAREWVRVARAEQVTHAMVVPTMLGRILDELGRDTLPALRSLSYGGGRMPAPVIERAMELLPHVDFVNAYGLTETSSTIAMLGPDDHRTAWASEDPAVRRRLGSVGRPVPSVELEICDAAGKPLPAGARGEIWVRGPQVAGEYLDRRAVRDHGWFPTKDEGCLDEAGYLFVEGRLDDVIVRGGENMSPGEIEDTLRAHPAVLDAAVVGLPDTEWGERVVAAVVLRAGTGATEEELRLWVRERLRSSRTPEHVTFRTALPYTDTGKLLRRELRAELVHEQETRFA